MEIARKTLPDGRTTGSRVNFSDLDERELRPAENGKPRRMKNTTFDDTGKPLWLWLRQMRPYGGSPLYWLLSGEPARVSGWKTANSEMAAELLYRVVRRWPGKILAVDSDVIARIAGRYNGNNSSLSQYLPRPAIGFLEALPDRQWFRRKIGATGWQGYTDCDDEAIREAAIFRNRELERPSVKRRVAVMSRAEFVTFILLTETKGLIHAKTWVRRQKNNSAKRLARAGFVARGVDVGRNQQRSGSGECASGAECGDTHG